MTRCVVHDKRGAADESTASTESATVRIFLLDDHEVVRRGLIEMFELHPDLEVVGETGSAVEALPAVAATKPDVAVIDVRLADGDGIEVCRDIHSNHPEVACLIFSALADDHAVIDAAMAGAAGYVLKRIDGNGLANAIRRVAAGEQLLDRAEVRLRFQRLKNSDEGVLLFLTPREQRIFELIGEGYSNRQIAEKLFLAEKTVKNYVSNLFVKLGVNRRTQAAALAARFDERARRRHEEVYPQVAGEVFHR